MNAVSTELSVDAFPLESPVLRRRPRHGRPDAGPAAIALPYFISGDENRLASYVCQTLSAVAQSPPLLVIGPEASGKTTVVLHLAARLAATTGDPASAKTVKYLTATDYGRDYAEAVASDDLPPLREAIDTAPILVIDDLQTIAGKMAAQDELAIRIEKRVEQGRPTLLTARRLPSELRGIRPQLASRCAIGLTIPLRYPGSESRRVALREIAMVREVELDDDLIGLLEAGLRADLSIPALEGAIKQIDLYCRMNSCQPCVAAVQSAINSAGQQSEVDLGQITRTVAKIWGHRTRDLRSGSRKQSVVRARSLAMLLARQMTSHSLEKIGQYFGGRDHSTVLHAIRKTESLLRQDDDLNRMMLEATEKLAA